MTSSVNPPYPIFTDTDGQPLEGGYIWIGTPGNDPQAFPKNAYWDDALTAPAAQPIRTVGGYPMRSGARAIIYTDGDHSIRVQNKNGTSIYSALESTQRFSFDQIGSDFSNTADITKGDALIGVKQPGAGAVARTQHDKNAEYVSVRDFGAIGDGITDDTAALSAAAAALEEGQILRFDGGEFLISIDSPSLDPYGFVVMNFENRRHIVLDGQGAKIIINNHNITTNKGLRFINLKGCKFVDIKNMHFEMTFSGVNTSGSYYPFCGAITIFDTDAAAPDFETLNSDITIHDCSFKLFHPNGCWSTSPSPFDGDSNNGYKLFTIFASGPNSANDYVNQCRNITIDNCVWRSGGNSYGIWTWAWNNVKITKCVAEAWVTKRSNHLGVYGGGGVAWARNIPFRCQGYVISDNQFLAMPTSDRVLGTGYEGVSVFNTHANNMGEINWGKGQTIISGNNVTLGVGALTTYGGANDYDSAIFFNGFGALEISNNVFDGTHGQSTAGNRGIVGMELLPGGTGGTETGFATIKIDGNIFGSWLMGGIYFTNGASVAAANRKCKALVVTNNIHLCGDYFLRLAAYSPAAFDGCELVIIANNVVKELRNAYYAPPSVNNYGIFLAGTESTDAIMVHDNLIVGKTYDIMSQPNYCSASANILRYNNRSSVTTPFLATNHFDFDTNNINVALEAVSADPVFQPYIKVLNTEAAPVEIRLSQQTTISYIVATNVLHTYTDNAVQTITDSNEFKPGADNTKKCGTAALRWSEVFAGAGAINTSDEREKEVAESIDPAVLRAWARVKYAQYRFRAAIQIKGSGARWHFGLVAQRVKEAFEAEGLDAFAYGLLCHDAWDESWDDGVDGGDRKLIHPAGERYGIRYEEALALECAYLRSKLSI